MKLMFFQLSEHPIRIRRNLLFFVVLSYLHVKVEPLSNITFSSIQLPDALITNGLIIGLSWFSINYFYYLYAELVEWKALHISRGEPDRRGSLPTTLIHEIIELADNTFQLNLRFSNSISQNLFQRDDVNEIEKTWGKQASVLADKVAAQVKDDVRRINEFKSAMTRYRYANRARFWVLDVAIPLLASTNCLFYLLKGAANVPVT
jgi:hypothetical protein